MAFYLLGLANEKDLINKDMAELAWASYSEGLNEEMYGGNSKGG